MRWNMKRQTGFLYLFEALLSFRMIDAVWVIFLLERGYSLTQVGIAEGVMHMASLICEIPTGMAADLFGRKRTLMFAGIAGMCFGILMRMDGWSGWVYVGMVFSALSYNLASGTQEALVYDSLLEAGQENRYRKVWSGINVTGRISRAVACALSPAAIAIGYRYTYGITAILCLGAVFLMTGVHEPIVTEAQRNRKQYRLCEAWERIRDHTADTFRFIRSHPRTMCKIFADAAISCPCYLILMYLQEHLVNCGWPKSLIGIPILLISVAGATGSYLSGRYSMTIRKTVFVCGLVSGIGTFLGGSSMIPVILLGACAVQISEGFSFIAISENVNHDFTSDQRATLVSVDSMMYSFLMVAASPITGFFGSRYGAASPFYLLGGILAVGAAAYGIIIKKVRE